MMIALYTFFGFIHFSISCLFETQLSKKAQIVKILAYEKSHTQNNNLLDERVLWFKY
jgi:hypothetical protein